MMAYIINIPIHNFYEGQSNENWTPATKWQRNLFYSKVIARSVNTFIPLGDETINSSLVERGRSLIDPQPQPSCTSSSKWNRCPQMSFFRSPKMWKSQGERSGLYGGCWMFPSLSPTRLAVWDGHYYANGWFRPTAFQGDFMANRSTLNHQKTNHTSLLFFACRHFQCCVNTLYTTLTSRALKKQVYGPVRFHYAFLLPYRWQYRFVTTVLPAFARNVFYGECSVFIWLPLTSWPTQFIAMYKFLCDQVVNLIK